MGRQSHCRADRVTHQSERVSSECETARGACSMFMSRPTRGQGGAPAQVTEEARHCESVDVLTLLPDPSRS